MKSARPSVYLRYAARDAIIAADGIGSASELAARLGAHIQASTEAAVANDLSGAVLALDAVDRCFRESGLWPGNIYLAGTGTLTILLHLAQDPEPVHRDPGVVLRELAALELAYLFPVASKFRSGEYDGQIQYRLNGWGRALATRLTAGAAGAACASALGLKIGQHLASEDSQFAGPVCRRKASSGRCRDLAGGGLSPGPGLICGTVPISGPSARCGFHRRRWAERAGPGWSPILGSAARG